MPEIIFKSELDYYWYVDQIFNIDRSNENYVWIFKKPTNVLKCIKMNRCPLNAQSLIHFKNTIAYLTLLKIISMAFHFHKKKETRFFFYYQIEQF